MERFRQQTREKLKKQQQQVEFGSRTENVQAARNCAKLFALHRILVTI